MKQEALLNFPHPLLMVGGLLIFFAVFLGLIVFVNIRAKQGSYDFVSKLPLDKLEKENSNV